MKCLYISNKSEILEFFFQFLISKWYHLVTFFFKQRNIILSKSICQQVKFVLYLIMIIILLNFYLEIIVLIFKTIIVVYYSISLALNLWFYIGESKIRLLINFVILMSVSMDMSKSLSIMAINRKILLFASWNKWVSFLTEILFSLSVWFFTDSTLLSPNTQNVFCGRKGDTTRPCSWSYSPFLA